jgi:type II secretory pathway pseudopilin PulG
MRVNSSIPSEKASDRWVGFGEGFTLVEFLSVFTIFVLLMGILFPVGERVVEKARRVVTVSHLRQVALAYTSCLQDDEEAGISFGEAKTASDWISILAQRTGLNEVALYLVKTDPLLVPYLSSLPKCVNDPKVSGKWRKNEDFARLPLPFVFIVGISPHAPLTTTPLAYTRGLNVQTGEWEDGVYGNEGGFVVFLDGHVKFFRTLKDGLVRYDGRSYTSRIRDATGPQTYALDWKGKVW